MAALTSTQQPPGTLQDQSFASSFRESTLVTGIPPLDPQVPVIVMPSGADPSVWRNGSQFVYTQTDIKGGARRILVSQAHEPHLLSHGPVKDILQDALHRSGFSLEEQKQFTNVWAPQIHQVGDRWVIIASMDINHNLRHRMYLFYSETKNPLGAYRSAGRIDPYNDVWAIDGALTYINGKLYCIWSGKDKRHNDSSDERITHPQHLKIAEVSLSKDPFSLTNDERRRKIILSPAILQHEHVIEAPSPLVHKGKFLGVLYSGKPCWTQGYTLYFLQYLGGDPLRRTSWKDHENPILTSMTFPSPIEKKFYVGDKLQTLTIKGIYGPGHCSTCDTDDGSCLLYLHFVHDHTTKKPFHAQRKVAVVPITVEDGIPVVQPIKGIETLPIYGTPWAPGKKVQQRSSSS